MGGDESYELFIAWDFEAHLHPNNLTLMLLWMNLTAVVLFHMKRVDDAERMREILMIVIQKGTRP